MEVELTIISGTALMAADANGKSDPCVKFQTSFSKKIKTKIIDKTLNPVWNEKFNVKVQPKEVITFKLYDHDTLSRDDDIGIASLAVPAMKKDDHWFDSIPVTKGGYLNVELHYISGQPDNICMHGFDPSELQVLKFSVQSIQNLIDNAIITRRVRVIISSEEMKPQFCKSFVFKEHAKVERDFYVRMRPGTKLTFTVEEKGGPGKYSKLTTTNYLCGDFREGQKLMEHLPMKNGATMHMEVTCVRSVYHNVHPHLIPPEDFETGPGKVCLYVEKAEGLKSKDLNGKSDPFIRFKGSQDKKEKKTFIVYKSLNPQWNQGFRIKCCPGEEILFQLFDHDTLSKDDKLGTCRAKNEGLNDSEWKQIEMILEKGKVYISMKLEKQLSPGYKKLIEGNGAPAPAAAYPPGGFPPPGYPGYPAPGAYPGYPGYPPAK